MSELIRVSEIFGPTIQGEGVLIGEPTVFVRTGGCDYRCSWCDSLHAVDSRFRDEWKPMTAEDIMGEIEELSSNTPIMVSLSGGNPAIQPFEKLIRIGHAKGYRFALETQGSITKDWFSRLDVLVLSPKPPSSGETPDWGIFEQCVTVTANYPKCVLKIIIFDDEDYKFARNVSVRFPNLPIYLQPGNHTPPPIDGTEGVVDMDGIMQRTEWLVEKVLSDHWFDAHILPQLHVLLWGNKRGV